MRVNNSYLYWGVFFLALGGAIVAVTYFAPDPTAIVDVLQYWPLAIIAIGVALVLRRTQFNVAGGVIAAAVPGLLLGGALAVGPSVGWDCTPDDGDVQMVMTDRGTFNEPARVDIETACGTLTINTRPGSDWDLTAGNTAGDEPDVDATAAGLSIRRDGEERWFGSHGRDDWRVSLPTARIADLDVTVNAGAGRTNLAGADIGTLALATNAGDSVVDLTTARVESIAATVNAGQLSVDLPAADDVRGSISVNAGQAQLCVPDSVGLRVRSSTTLGSTHLDGLVQRDGAWESPDYASAAHHADLTVSVNLGNLDINPVGGCK
jgi:hypothetical protein